MLLGRCLENVMLISVEYFCTYLSLLIGKNDKIFNYYIGILQKI